MTDVKRATRVSGQLRQHLVSQLRSLSDPRLSSASITRVELTDDLQLARIYVRRELGDGGDGDRARLLRGFEAAGKRLRRGVGKALGLRYTPDLRFFYDDGVEASARVDALLHEIAAERADDEPTE